MVVVVVSVVSRVAPEVALSLALPALPELMPPAEDAPLLVVLLSLPPLDVPPLLVVPVMPVVPLDDSLVPPLVLPELMLPALPLSLAPLAVLPLLSMPELPAAAPAPALSPCDLTLLAFFLALS